MRRDSQVRRIVQWLVLLCCLAIGMAAADVPVPPLQHRVTDLTGTLTAQQQAELEASLVAFETRKGSQIAILLVPTTQPEDIAQYSIRVVEAWKLGRKGVDDGVLVLLAKDDRKSRIEVGYGLEGALNDATAKRILSEVMTPYFKQGDFFGGLKAGVDKIQSVIDGEPLPEPEQHAAGGDGFDYLVPLFFAGLVIGAVLRGIFGGFVGGLLNGGIMAGLMWLLGGGLLFALIIGFVVFLFTLVGGLPGGHGGRGGGGFGGVGGSGGGYSSGGYSGGGFSGGGGGFGGGGASGDW